jgi:hypothetical protein
MHIIRILHGKRDVTRIFMSGPVSDWRRWTERRIASLKTTFAMPWTRWDPNLTPFSRLKVF